MSDHIDNNKIAYVAIKRYAGDALFAYLPSQDIPLPKGWEWNVIDGVCDTEDVSGVAASMGMTSLDEVCRLMCSETGVTWGAK